MLSGSMCLCPIPFSCGTKHRQQLTGLHDSRSEASPALLGDVELQDAESGQRQKVTVTERRLLEGVFCCEPSVQGAAGAPGTYGMISS